MRKSAPILFICMLAVALCVGCLLFACESKTSVSVSLSGAAYRGAVVDVSARVVGFDSTEGAEFKVVQSYEWVYFSAGKLVFDHNAVVGATVTVRVSLGGKSADSSVIVGHTPVDSVQLSAPVVMAAGESRALAYSVTPAYADDVPVTFSLLSGGNVATLNGNMLAIADTADKSDSIVLQISAGEKSSQETVSISTVQPKALEIQASATVLRRGETSQLSCVVTPEDCTLGVAKLIVEDSPYYTYSNGALTVLDNAPEGEIDVFARLGMIEAQLKLSIAKTEVLDVGFTSDSTTQLRLGDNVRLSASVQPANATYPDITITVQEGADCIAYNDSLRSFSVVTAEVGKQIVFTATAGDITKVLAFETVKIDVESIELVSDGESSVSVGDRRKLTATVMPSDATYGQVTLSVTQGAEHVTFENEVLWFDSISQGITTVTVTAVADGIVRKLDFFIVPVPVERVEISTSSPIVDLCGGDSVVFSAAVYPSHASYPQVEFKTDIQGFGSFSDNVFTVADSVGTGIVNIYAVSPDGMESNRIQLSILGELVTIAPTSWAAIDNKSDAFDGIGSLRLVLSDLERNTDFTTVIISDDVEYLELWGAYDGYEGAFLNLYFYFLTSDFATVKLYNMGLICNSGFTGTVMDFGNEARVYLELCGTNTITAADAYCAYSEGYAVDGQFTGENDYIRKHGMDGFGGLNGGDCINACMLEIGGMGTLSLYAGSGASGTNGTDGANSDSGVAAGSGGDGGYGGDSGYAVFAKEIILNSKGAINAYGGDAGKGGTGGKRGISVDTAFNGAAGGNGPDGTALVPIYAVSSCLDVSKKTQITTGTVRDRTELRQVTEASAFSSVLEKYYKLDIVYGSSVNNPYSSYSMSYQTSNSELCHMLYALDYALSVFPKSLLVEVSMVNNDITINLVDKIKKGLSVIYGLTSSSNVVWLACFNTKLRDTFYSTHYNIYIHELFHVLTFSMGSLSGNPMSSGLRVINDCSYTTSSAYVYDPENGCKADTARFLTRYSKSNFNEDISDNISLISMLVSKADFLQKGYPLYEKLTYISLTYENFYRSLCSYSRVVWKKFIV